MSKVEYFVEHFLEPLQEGQPAPPIRYDEARGLNVLPDGRALVDVELEGGTVTGTKAGGEQDDADRDPEPTTFTMVQSEGVDDAAQVGAVQAGTITVTEATGEASDSDEYDNLSPTYLAPQSGAWELGLLGTVTHTAVEAESSDID